MNHSEIIDQLGGSGVVARALGVDSPVVANWRKRGVPWRWRLAIAQLAAEHEIEVPKEFMPPERVQ